jgi:putative lipoprotein
MLKHAIAAAVIGAMLALVSPAQAAEDAWWGRDKALHFGVSVGLGATGYGVSSLVLEQRWQRGAVGAGFSLSLGAAKEFVDLNGGGQASGRDMAWNVIGTATGVGLAWVVDILLGARRANAEGASRSELSCCAARPPSCP